ncbi:MAG: oligosaccharide flippase family protein [Methylophaga sp.]|uniref:lipopolysaccharide biosynthesis protein n=1 Tax=Methylophaga sp. TaxID=2024840 RepID=UPI000C0CFD38|nr:oligosaccharide flippase family protein [Methylophaga sp.]MBL1457970.1 oligosaccharide flippase family protein [Methylophaga sp.]
MNWLNNLELARFKRLSKESLWIISGQFLAIIGAMVGVRVLTELLNPEAYGQLALGMTLAIFATQGGFGPLSAGATRFFSAAKESDELKIYLDAVKRYLKFITIFILALTTAIVLTALSAGLGFWSNLILASMVYACVNGYNNIANGIQNAARQRSVVALHSGIGPWLRLFFAVALIYLFGESSSSVMWGYVIATIIVLFSQYVFFRKIFKDVAIESPVESNEINKAWQEKILNYSWPFVTWGTVAALHSASDKWSLALFSSQSDAGFFLVLYQIGFYPIAIFSEMLVAFVTPIIFQRAGHGGASSKGLAQAIKLNIRVSGLIFIVSILIFIFMWLSHEVAFSFLAADEYRPISFLLPWMGLSAGLISTAQVLSISRMSSLQTKSLIIPKVISPVIGIFLNLAGAYFYGLEGVVFAHLLYALIYLGWMTIQYANYARSHTSVISTF